MDDSESLQSHARGQIRQFLELLTAQKRAIEQGIPKVSRRKDVPPYVLPPKYDPHSEFSDTHKGDAIYRLVPSGVWSPQRSLLSEMDDNHARQLCSNVGLIDYGLGSLAQSEAEDWQRKFKLSPSTAMTFHSGYWRSFDPSDDSKIQGRHSFELLQDWCLQAKLKKCSSAACEAMRQNLEHAIPRCSMWPEFREWILVAESCQLSAMAKGFLWLDFFTFRDMVFWLMRIWKGIRKPYMIGLAFDIYEIFWFHRSQVQKLLSIGAKAIPGKDGPTVKPIIYPHTIFGFDESHFHKASQKAISAAISLGICPKRLWDLASMMSRGHVDMPAILEIVQSSAHPQNFAHRGHDQCNSEFCEFADENSVLKRQLHKCSDKTCNSMDFPTRSIVAVINSGQRVAWKFHEGSSDCLKPFLVNSAADDGKSKVYDAGILAISHVWSDGTGVGVRSPGSVNKCLVEFFFSIAKRLGCDGLWWDAICVPVAETDEEKKARSAAISKIHENYSHAKHTLVHDQYLLQIDWAEDGSPAVALVLSPWFSRGWTALEFSVSKSVKVLYRDSENPGSFLAKDLDQDILAQGPFDKLGHVAASALLLSLRGKPSTLIDLLSTLSTRSTSWNRDRMAIAAHLARVKDYDHDSPRVKVIQQIFKEYVIFDQRLLHHGQAPPADTGYFSWCPSRLLPNSEELRTIWNPVDERLRPFVRLSQTPGEDGSVLGSWKCTILDRKTLSEVRPVTRHLKTYEVLDNTPPECLVVLHSPVTRLPDLLVITTGLWHCKEDFVPEWASKVYYIECHYAGCVNLASGTHNLRPGSSGPYQFKVGTQVGKKSRPAKYFLNDSTVPERVAEMVSIQSVSGDSG